MYLTKTLSNITNMCTNRKKLRAGPLINEQYDSKMGAADSYNMLRAFGNY
jgi:hypothetical protein